MRQWRKRTKRREAELRTALAAASDAGESGSRRLVRAKGDDLVGAVEVALRALGFDVENRDLVNAVAEDCGRISV